MRRLTAVLSFSSMVVALSVVIGGAQQPSTQPSAQPPRPNTNFPRVQLLPFPTAPQTFETLGPPATSVRVSPFITGLANPWSIAFLPDGSMLVTEKAGRLRIVRKGTLDPTPIAGVPAVFTTGQGGLLEVSVHPRYAENRFIYLTYSKSGRTWRDYGARTRHL